MRRLFVASIALLACGHSASAASKADLLARCSVKNPATGETYIPEKNFPALSRLLTDPVLAANTEGCKGQMSAKERAAYEEGKAFDANLALRDLKTIQRRHHEPTPTPGAPTETVRDALDIASKDKAVPIIVRDAYSLTSLGALLKAQNESDGASFTYTRDFQNDTAITALTGSAYGYFDMFPEPKDESAKDKGVDIAPFSRIILAPGVEFDQQRNRANSSKNIDYLGFRLLSEFHLPGGPLLHLFRVGGALKTDSRGDSKIWSGIAEWQPVSNRYGLSSGRAIFPDWPLFYRFDPVLHVEHEEVVAAGDWTGIADGDRYTRAGPILKANFWFAEGPDWLQRLKYGIQYRHLWGNADSGQKKDVHYWQTSLAYNLDEHGHAAITTTYRQGDLPGNGEEVRDFKTGLAVKF